MKGRVFGRFHVFPVFGDKIKPHLRQRFCQFSGQITLVPRGQALEAFEELWGGSAIIGVAGRQTEGHQFPLMVDDDMQLEAIEPTHR